MLDFFVEYPFVLNICLSICLLLFCAINFNYIKPIVALFVYSLFHYFYIPLIWLSPNKQNYLNVFLNMNFEVKLSFWLISFLSIFSVIVVFWLKIKRTIGNKILINKIIKLKFFLFLFALWILSILLQYFIFDTVSILNIKFLFVKLLMLSIFLTFYIVINYLDLRLTDKNLWLKYKNLLFLIPLIITVYIIFEFSFYNVLTERIYINEITHADITRMLRPVGSFYNPNQLGLFGLCSIMFFTLISFNNFKFINLIMIVFSTIIIYISLSRSINLATLFFFGTLVFIQILYNRKDLLISLLSFLSYFLTFLVFIYVGIKEDLNTFTNNTFFNMYDRYQNTFNVIQDYILGTNQGSTPETSSANVRDRFSESSTDNTFILLYNTEGILSTIIFTILIATFLYYLIKIYIKNKNSHTLGIICVHLTLIFILTTLNLFAVYPFWLFFIFFMIYSYYLIKKNLFLTTKT